MKHQLNLVAIAKEWGLSDPPEEFLAIAAEIFVKKSSEVMAEAYPLYVFRKARAAEAEQKEKDKLKRVPKAKPPEPANALKPEGSSSGASGAAGSESKDVISKDNEPEDSLGARLPDTTPRQPEIPADPQTEPTS